LADLKADAEAAHRYFGGVTLPIRPNTLACWRDLAKVARPGPL